MESDAWSTRTSISSKRYQSRSDLYMGGVEEMEGEDDMRMEYVCPFCAEDFDVVGLCCHIDEEHPVEAKNGVCPVCAKRVGMDLVGHFTSQHGSLLKVQRKRRFRKAGSHSTFSMLRKELREGNLHSFFGGSSFKVPVNSEADPLLSSFISNVPPADEALILHSASEPVSGKQSKEESSSERTLEPAVISDKDQQEQARKCEFVRGLLLSTILDDSL